MIKLYDLYIDNVWAGMIDGRTEFEARMMAHCCLPQVEYERMKLRPYFIKSRAVNWYLQCIPSHRRGFNPDVQWLSNVIAVDHYMHRMYEKFLQNLKEGKI